MPSNDSHSTFVSLPIYCLLAFIAYLYLFVSFSGNYASDILKIPYVELAYVLTAILISIPVLLYFKIGFKAFLRADVLVSTSIVYWALLDLLQERYQLNSSSPESIRYAFVLIAVFVIMIQLGARISFPLPKIVNQARKLDINRNYLFGIVIGCFLIGLFPFYRGAYYDFSYMVSALTRPRFAAPWARGQFGGFSAFIEHLKYFGYFLPAATVLLGLREGKLNWKVILAGLLTIFFSAFEFQGGGRRIIGFLYGSGIATYLVARWRDLSWKKLAVIGALFIGLLVLLDMQLQFRNKGYANMFDKYEVSNFEEVRVDDNFYRITQIIDFVPELHPFAGTQYLIYSFGRPIPRVIWSGKPLNPGFDLAKMADEYGVTLSMTVIGEAYASFGLIMVALMGLFYGVLAGTFNRILNERMGILGYAIYALGTMALVAGVRSLIDLILFSYALLGVLFIFQIYLKRKGTIV
jgi:oligosaccharide repeat unit polymerase